MKTFEIIAIIATILSVLTARVNSKSTWVFSIISCLIYMYIFNDTKLYYQALLQIIFFVQSIIGLVEWSDSENDIKYISDIQIVNITFLISILISLIFILPMEMNKNLDFISTLGAFIATYLLSKKYSINWILWAFSNMIASILFYRSGLMFTSILYISLTIHAIYAYYEWNTKTTNEIQ